MYNACAAFDHGVEAAHDDEIRVGADTAIFKHLTFLLFKRGMLERDKQHESRERFPEQQTENDGKCDDKTSGDNDSSNAIMEEITSTLQGLEMVLRCSADCISVSFARMGSEVLPILISLLQEQRSQKDEHKHVSSSSALRDLNHAHSNSFQSASTASSTMSNVRLDSTTNHTVPRPTRDAIFKTATKIIGHFARVGSLTDTLASTNYLLTTLKQITAMPKESSVPTEARLNCLWIIANLACSAENMIKMASHPGLVDTLVQVASHPTKEEEETCESVMEYLKILRSRSIAVRAILNLSWAHENKIALTENSTLVEALLMAASHRQSSWTGDGKGVSWILMQSRRHAAGALRNLAAAPRRYKRRLCRLRDDTFLETLAEIATLDPDSVVRDKIHATLYNLVSADTAKLFIEKQVVLDIIVNAATSGDDSGGKDPDCAASCTMAIQTLRSLEKAIPEDEEDYEVLRPVLSRFDSQIAMNKSQSRLGMSISSETAV